MNTMPVHEIGTLLGVWAHPDDEAYLSAGLMARVRQLGGRVVVATATRGELGTDDPDRWPPERLALRREEELHESLTVLGVEEHHWLDHRDGTLASVAPGHGVEQVAALVDEVRPDVLVTFGPDGMTGHDDHRTISAWATEAWRRTGAHGALWYATLTPEWHATWEPVNRELGVWYDGSTPPVTPRRDLAAHLRCGGHLMAKKEQALRAHATQTEGLQAILGPVRFRSWWADEAFVAA
jgi:LmbE family N-acetylglucosaminyl deacetylase